MIWLPIIRDPSSPSWLGLPVYKDLKIPLWPSGCQFTRNTTLMAQGLLIYKKYNPLCPKGLSVYKEYKPLWTRLQVYKNTVPSWLRLSIYKAITLKTICVYKTNHAFIFESLSCLTRPKFIAYLQDYSWFLKSVIIVIFQSLFSINAQVNSNFTRPIAKANY